jgi:hypothetical protein
VLLSPQGRVVTSGTHTELLGRTDADAVRYRDVVGRSMTEEPDAVPAAAEGAAR